MKNFKIVFGTFIILCTFILTGCGGGGGGSSSAPTPQPSSAKDITSYSINGVQGKIDETNKTITLTLPADTALTNLIATFTAIGDVKVGTVEEVSGTTPNDFTKPVIYTVTAHDGSSENFTVTVTTGTPVPPPVNDSWNIRIFNNTNQQMYYLVTDLTFNDPALHPEMKGSLAVGATANIELKHTENHQAGRVYISENPINYSKGSTPPLGDNYNLFEYSVGYDSNGKPFTDYDVSAVDSIYGMPFAVEAVDKSNHSDGWVGMNDNNLFNEIKTFTQETNWPTFANSTKIPGAYNLFEIPANQLSGSAVAVRETLTNRWKFWNTGSPEAICTNNTNGRSYDDCVAFARTVQFIHPAPLNDTLLADLYGYVGPYNYVGSPYAPYVIALLRGLSYSSGHEDTNPDHLYPEYDSMYCFDPYVTFVHKKSQLHIYAFSIDDSIGNIYKPGMLDLDIDVGSIARLPNQKAY